MISENPWYVMYGPRRVLRTPSGKSARTIEYFRTEDEAREFARKALDEGHIVEAGTTPGVEPAKKVLPAELEAWCAEMTVRAILSRSR
jgi:hypothetical protein